MLKGREGMLKGRGGDVEGRGEDVEGNGGANGKGDGEGMVLHWHRVILPRRRLMLWSRRRCVALFRVVVAWLRSASSSRGFVPRRRRCASSRGFVIARWRVVVLRPCRAVDLSCRLVPLLSGCQ